MKKNNILSVYLTNLGKYNEGELIGEWLQLPATESEINETLEHIGINEQYEEYFITDFESNLGICCNEFDNIFELNEIAKALENLTALELSIIEALVKSGNYEIDEALKIYDDVVVYSDCYDMTDVAYEYVENNAILDQIPKDLQYYFDYEKFGRDLEIEGTFIYYDGCYFEVLA